MLPVIPVTLIQRWPVPQTKIMLETINELFSEKIQSGITRIHCVDPNSLIKLHYAFQTASSPRSRQQQSGGQSYNTGTLHVVMQQVVSVATQAELVYIEVMLNMRLAQLYLHGSPGKVMPSMEKSESYGLRALDILENLQSKLLKDCDQECIRVFKQLEWTALTDELFSNLEYLFSDWQERSVIFKWLPQRKGKIQRQIEKLQSSESA
ncbi:hypothetical protein MP228_009142 [Amoeboaphelidium protococcarum]|nr:hypothetical protein MP228_009142 [Amoeboaphelidium protococcarum]